MTIRSRTLDRLAASCVAAIAVGCTTLSTDPLSPPLVQKSSQAIQATTAAAEQRLPAGHQAWLCEVRHFWSDTKHEFGEEFRTNKDWPAPYDELAKRATREPFDLQAANGRLQLVSIWDFHFEPGTGRLTTMGRNRLQSIVEQADTLGHTVYVRRTLNPKETAARLESVREELKNITEDPDSFEVAEAKATPSSVGGQEAQKAMDRMLNPPKSGQASSGGASSGQSGGN